MTPYLTNKRIMKSVGKSPKFLCSQGMPTKQKKPTNIAEIIKPILTAPLPFKMNDKAINGSKQVDIHTMNYTQGVRHA